jgi:transcription elongation GreA/GreB family factor
VVDKARLLSALRDRVAADREALERRQRDAQEGSTHDESRAEHAKDTRATEQSYLARGLAERVEELRRTAAALAVLDPGHFGSEDPIAVTALVTLSMEGEGSDDRGGNEQSWWIVASAGGFQLELEGVRVRTITPVSPLGRALLGLQAGDEGSYRTPRGERRFEVLEVR